MEDAFRKARMQALMKFQSNISFYSSILNIFTDYSKQTCKQNNIYIVHLNISAVITECNVFGTSHILCMCHCQGEPSLHALYSLTILELCSNIRTMCMVCIDLCVRPTQVLPHVHTLFPRAMPMCECAHCS